MSQGTTERVRIVGCNCRQASSSLQIIRGSQHIGKTLGSQIRHDILVKLKSIGLSEVFFGGLWEWQLDRTIGASFSHFLNLPLNMTGLVMCKHGDRSKPIIPYQLSWASSGHQVFHPHLRQFQGHSQVRRRPS